MNDLFFLLFPFTLIGWVFTTLLAAGLTMNGVQCAMALDQFVGTCIIAGHIAGRSASAWVHRNQCKRTELFINWIFRDDHYCAKAYISELHGIQNMPDYRH